MRRPTRRPARRPAGPAVLLAAVPLLAAPAAARGQAGAAPRAAEGATADATAPAPGRIAGQIVDASTGEALPEALVLLVAQPEGVLPPAGAGASAFPAAARRARSDAAGRYQFAAVAPGSYRLHATRLGYAAAAVDVRVADAAPEVSLGLTVAPLALRPVEVRATGRRAPEAHAAVAGDGAADGRVAAAALRQRAYLTTDARELTRADVGEAATLAESDLFRALHRLPGVSTRDEWAAELWTRGARPDLTRVTLDGLPLFSPVAAFGAFAAVNADAVGSATLLPGVRPASVGEGGAAVLDLRTRAGGRAGGRAAHGVAGAGELGVASARLTLDGDAAGGRAAWLVSARRSYLDGVAALVDGRSRGVPDFGDLTARADLALGPSQRLVVSGLVQRTRSAPDMSPLQTGGRGVAWGNRLARVTHAAAGRGLAVTHTLGVSTHAFASRGGVPAAEPYAAPGDTAPAAPVAVSGHPDVRVSALVLRGELAPAARGAPGEASPSAAAEPAWNAGYELSRQRARVVGGGRRFFVGGYPMFPAWTADALARDSVVQDGAVTAGAVWAARRWRPSPRLEVEPGLRLDLAAGRAGGPAALRPGPRLAARYTLGGGARLSAAVGRSVQYTQALARVGLDNDARFYPGALWFAAGRGAPGGAARAAFAGDVPALTTDLATLGAERWLGSGWLASANAYARRTRGLLTYDPAPGALADAARALVVPGRERAAGVELSARRLVGRTTATLAYSWGASTVDAGGWRYRAPQDRPHAFDATVSRRLGARWRVGGALSVASGTPYARTVARLIVDSAGAIRSGATVRDVPGSRRNPPFRGADLLVEWTRPVRGWHLGAFAQLHSPLATVSSDAYRGGEVCYVAEGSAPGAVFGPSARCVTDRPARELTFPVIPVVGVRWAF